MKYISNRISPAFCLALGIGMLTTACGDDGGTTSPGGTINTNKADSGAHTPATSAKPTSSPSNVTEEDSGGEPVSTSSGTSAASNPPVTTASATPGASSSPVGATDASAPTTVPLTDGAVPPDPTTDGDAGTKPDADVPPVVACYPDGQPAAEDPCPTAFPMCGDDPNPAMDLCEFYLFGLVPELFDAGLDCFDDSNVDACDPEAMTKLRTCVEGKAPNACTVAMSECDVFVGGCTEMTVTECNAMMAGFNSTWRMITTTPMPYGSDCLAPSGGGCRAAAEACVYGPAYAP